MTSRAAEGVAKTQKHIVLVAVARQFPLKAPLSRTDGRAGERLGSFSGNVWKVLSQLPILKLFEAKCPTQQKHQIHLERGTRRDKRVCTCRSQELLVTQPFRF